MTSPARVEICGEIASGKTTLAKILARAGLRLGSGTVPRKSVLETIL